MHSQNSYIKRRTKQEEYLGQKHQEQYRQVVLTGTIQTVFTAQDPAQSTRPYIEYHTTQNDTDNKDTDSNDQPLEDENYSQEQVEDNYRQSDETLLGAQDPEDTTLQLSEAQQETGLQNSKPEPSHLQFVDMEGRPSDKHLRQRRPTYSTPTPQPQRYYYPQVPPPSLGRGKEQKAINQWLEDNPTRTESDFWWLRQNQLQIPPFSPAAGKTESGNYMEDDGQYHDAQ